MPIKLQHSKQRGFSLIELIIFIVIISISFTAISLVYISTTRNSADPLIRIKSVELAQSMLEEILLKAYDDNTPLGGGCVQMPNQGNTRCTSGINASVELDANLGAEEGITNRLFFDDVDDYHNLAYCGIGGVADAACTNTCIDMVDESDNLINQKYAGFAICVRVSFAGGAGTEISNFTSGVPVEANDAKRIDVIVTDQVKSNIHLTAYSLNY